MKIGRRPKRCWRCRRRLLVGDWIERRKGWFEVWVHRYGCPPNNIPSFEDIDARAI